MPTIATQTEPMWDVIDKLNKEFDDLHKDYQIEKEINYLNAKLAHKNTYKEVLEDLLETWEDDWGQLDTSYWDAHKELDDDLDAYFGR